jgi:hypothetical protein
VRSSGREVRERGTWTYEGSGDLVQGLLEFGLRGKVGHDVRYKVVVGVV